MFKKAAVLIVLSAMGALPALAASYQNVPVVDVGCSKKAASNPDAHTRDCALACAKSGFGIVTKDQQFLKFDATGNAKIAEELKASSQKDHLRVNVSTDWAPGSSGSAVLDQCGNVIGHVSTISHCDNRRRHCRVSGTPLPSTCGTPFSTTMQPNQTHSQCWHPLTNGKRPLTR